MPTRASALAAAGVAAEATIGTVTGIEIGMAPRGLGDAVSLVSLIHLDPFWSIVIIAKSTW